MSSDELSFIMEAHNGISAKIVEEEGFKAIWASSLTISGSLGVRDNNEASWTQVLEVLEFMNDAVDLPILLDGDTGYGNFNNFRRLVKKLEQRGIAGVCIEDKLFPKTNSFINSEAQPLADIEEFCGKIKAAKDTQIDKDFVVVARIESFIAGWGLQETLKRAEAYRQAGADVVLIHSKKPNASEIEAFMSAWEDKLPVVIVPTKYYSTPTDLFRKLGVRSIIWANHLLRSSIQAMRMTARQIHHDESLVNVEDSIASVSEIFKYQGCDELKEAEKHYLPTYGKNVSALILAASRGNLLGVLTQHLPKAMLKVNGKPILEQQIQLFRKMEVQNISVVRGYRKETIQYENLSYIDNDDNERSSELYSLYLAKDKLEKDTLICYGDILFRSSILNDLLNQDHDITIVVDADAEATDGYHEYVKTSKKYNVIEETANLVEMSSDLKADQIHGEFIGLWYLSNDGSAIVKETLEELFKEENFMQMRMADLMNKLLKKKPIRILYIHSSWLDVDTITDLHKAGELKCCP